MEPSKVASQKAISEMVRLGDWCLDISRQQLWKGGKYCHIPPLEARLLKALMEAKGKCVTGKCLCGVIQAQARRHSKTVTIGRVMAGMSAIRGLIRNNFTPGIEHVVREGGAGYSFQI